MTAAAAVELALQRLATRSTIEPAQPGIPAESKFQYDSREQAGKIATMRNRKFLLLLITLLLASPARAQQTEAVVSFKCALAIDAVLAELDKSADNLVVRQALSGIDDINGQLVCIDIDAKEIQVRLQSTDMHPNDNRLVFSLDARTYVVKKTFYGR